MPQPKPLPAASLHLLLALLDGKQHGYRLMSRVTELSDGAVRMGPGTLYGTLSRLVRDGLIVETTDSADRTDRTDPGDNERRRYYELTSLGRDVATVEVARLQRMLQRIASHLAGPAGP